MPLLFAAGAVLLRAVFRDRTRPAARMVSARVMAVSAAAGAAVAAAWLAPIPGGYLLGRLSFTYGQPYFDPGYRLALPAVGILVLAAFVAGLEPYLRDGRGTPERRMTVTVVALVVLSGLRGRPGQGGWPQWELLIWECFCLRLAALALIRLTGTLLGSAVLLAVVTFARFWLVSRVDGAHDTLAHYVASPHFHLGLQLFWPPAAAAALLLAARRAAPKHLVGTW